MTKHTKYRMTDEERQELIYRLSAIGNAAYYMGLEAICITSLLEGRKSGFPIWNRANRIRICGSDIKNLGEKYIGNDFSPKIFYPGADFTQPIVSEYIDKFVRQLKSEG